MSREAIASDRAARWILAREESDWSLEDQARLDAWLAESFGNRAAYLRLLHTWSEADRIAALSRTSSEALRQGSKSRWSKWAIPAAMAATFAVVITGIQFSRMSPQSPTLESFSTAIGQQRTIELADGSRVLLNTGSEVGAAVRQDTREIWLNRGEAYFDVARNANVPFVVHMGDRKVTVLGTKFSVRRAGEKAVVSVLEGRVRLDELEDGHTVRSAILVKGDVAISRGSAMIVTKSAPNVLEDALSWRDGMLSFNQRSLAEIAAEFNRYNARKLIITDQEAATMRIGGIFPANDPEGFVRLLRDAYGLRVEHSERNFEISRP